MFKAGEIKTETSHFNMIFCIYASTGVYILERLAVYGPLGFKKKKSCSLYYTYLLECQQVFYL